MPVRKRNPAKKPSQVKVRLAGALQSKRKLQMRLVLCDPFTAVPLRSCCRAGSTSSKHHLCSLASGSPGHLGSPGKPSEQVTELICTVSGFAVFSTMYPPDGLCRYLFYCNVVVTNASMVGVEVSISWEVFKKQMKKFKKTSGGISFDSRYVTAASIKPVEKQLKDMARNNNIKHYGVLNMLTVPAKAHGLLKQMKVLLKKLKNIQGTRSTRKTILAMGLYDYGMNGEYYTDFSLLFKDAIESSNADTVIAISSVGWLHDPSKCECTPPSVWDVLRFGGLRSILGKKYPDLKRQAALMSKQEHYNNSKVKMGLSFELATLAYNTTYDYIKQNAVDFAKMYTECNLFFTTNFDVVPCKINADSNRALVHPDVGMAFPKSLPSLILLFEDEDTLEKKCKDLIDPSTNLRPNMAILLLNVHLGDYDIVNKCVFNDPQRSDHFWRIRVVKKTLKIP
ncbi:hypothetical protein HPB49_021338 [Dermacentor silvarum]|uniref:Uncharacterized protein n=1 Tax=Dermacentor silvarum TaxID=543639 RepID=A0ACB8DL73_DERSI|nr:hypothetical protein HPB49_021338 [Dermacentor silvarum]